MTNQEQENGSITALLRTDAFMSITALRTARLDPSAAGLPGLTKMLVEGDAEDAAGRGLCSTWAAEPFAQ